MIIPNFFRILFYLALCTCSWIPLAVYAQQNKEFPVLYHGRYLPAEAYARVWLYDFYHAPVLKKEEVKAAHLSSTSALDFLWTLEIQGFDRFEKLPLFWIGSAELKQNLELPLKRNRFSAQELSTLPAHLLENQSVLSAAVKQLQRLHGSISLTERAFAKRVLELQTQTAHSAKEIGQILEQEFPLNQRLKNAGILFKSLPSRYQKGDWFPLNAVKVQVYHPATQALKEVGNFTLYSDQDFQAIRNAYLKLEEAYVQSNSQIIAQAKQQLGDALWRAYQSLEGQAVQEAHGKQLNYPTYLQLKMEALYVDYPWIPVLIALYGIGAVFLCMAMQLNSIKLRHLSMVLIGMAIFFHTALLAMRCYILGRPPVSNMFETVIYVPWIAACTSLLFPAFRKNSLALLAACVTAIGLLAILEIADLNQGFDQVQAVLDSQFWLLIHVLLVVGSYGVFILGAILGHFYLALFLIYRKETETMKQLSGMILQTMYGGAALLISGTILGGIWAAESWGRFWDWDPKESWAFISSCFYLIWIHAYRFHRIGSFGLAAGAVSGLLAISFTWYGVNYILGTGLHSYGFGSGGELYYYSFLLAEVLFLVIALWVYSQVSSQIRRCNP